MPKIIRGRVSPTLKTYSVYLALGTNLGNRLENLRRALDALCELVHLDRVSRCYETEPWGIVDQPTFLNIACSGTTLADPQELLAFVKKLEVRMGRHETVRYGPRLIDVDILFFDSLVLETPSLTIPHPRLHERAFVLVPLADIAPQLAHPVTHKTVAEMLADVNARGVNHISTDLENHLCNRSSHDLPNASSQSQHNLL
ncbi:MAG: 2-amino-4-hydroxy-6-hydroxymethyldihydropteridine diphosphokinase [Aggregatilineales bacterium]